MTYMLLVIEFSKIGLFAFGGGFATIPFLYVLADKYPWFDKETLTNMIAVSESTPGPIGVNMATYTGFHVGGVLGGIVATLALIIPSFVIIIIVAKFLEKFRDSFYVNSVFYGLRPAVTGLIASAGLLLINIAVLTLDKFAVEKDISLLIDVKYLIMFAIFLYLTNKFDRHPIFFIAGAAVIGIVFKL